MESIDTTLEHRMLNDTLGAFGDGFTIIPSAEQGILLLEGWLNALAGDIGTERLIKEIETLRDHLKTGQYDNEKIRHLLLSMANHTIALSQEPSIDNRTSLQIKQLANILRNFTSQF